MGKEEESLAMIPSFAFVGIGKEPIAIGSGLGLQFFHLSRLDELGNGGLQLFFLHEIPVPTENVVELFL
jgi:hypothetical protein